MSENIPNVLCPNCGHLLELASGIVDPTVTPHEGDIVLCIDCAHAMKFDKDMSLVPATPEDLATLPPEQTIAMNDAQKFIIERGRLSDVQRNNVQ